MIIIIIYSIISFLLDGLISNYIQTSLTSPSIFTTIYSIISLVIIYNFFDDDKKYLKILLVIAILFDITYTNTFILNIILFFIIYLIIKTLNYYIPNNLFTINIKSLIAISIYHILSYIILLLVHYNNYPVFILYKVLYRSIIMTIIYTTITYLIIKKIYYKYYDKKIK